MNYRDPVMPKIIKFTQAQPTETVLLEEKPTSPGSKPTIREVPVKEFAASVGIQWLDTSLVVKNVNFKPFPSGALPEHPFKTLTKEEFNKKKEQAASSHSSFFLRKGEAGYGAFALKHVPPNTAIAMYTGDLIIVHPRDLTEDMIGPYTLACRLSDKIILFNAESAGNLSRFFQDLPSENEDPEDESVINFSDYQFNPPRLAKKVAKANTVANFYQYEGYPFCFLESTNKGIQPDQQGGYPYGDVYWRGLKTDRRLFDDKGALIPRSQYSFNPVVEIHFRNEATGQDMHFHTKSISLSHLRRVAAQDDADFGINAGEHKIPISVEVVRKALRTCGDTPQFICLNTIPEPKKELESKVQPPQEFPKTQGPDLSTNLLGSNSPQSRQARKKDTLEGQPVPEFTSYK